MKIEIEITKLVAVTHVGHKKISLVGYDKDGNSYTLKSRKTWGEPEIYLEVHDKASD